MYKVGDVIKIRRNRNTNGNIGILTYKHNTCNYDVKWIVNTYDWTDTYVSFNEVYYISSKLPDLKLLDILYK